MTLEGNRGYGIDAKQATPILRAYLQMTAKAYFRYTQHYILVGPTASLKTYGERMHVHMAYRRCHFANRATRMAGAAASTGLEDRHMFARKESLASRDGCPDIARAGLRVHMQQAVPRGTRNRTHFRPMQTRECTAPASVRPRNSRLDD